MTQFAVELDSVGKSYVKHSSLASRLSHVMSGSAPADDRAWALRDVSIKIPVGACVGIIGLNGSGKSTLLKIISGTLAPTTGRVVKRGRVAALLELSSGFDHEFTGTENVIFNGLAAGLSRVQIERKFDEIARFADIGDAIDAPVKTYSTGMLARLAFALHTVLEPDILIIDEILAVGDYFFQQKCYRRLAQMKEAGVTQLFVSHDLAVVRDLCDMSVYLKSGRMDYFGGSTAAIHRLLADGPATPVAPARPAQERSSPSDPTALPEFSDAVWKRSAVEGLRLLAVRLVGVNGLSAPFHRLGSRITIEAWFRTFPGDEGLTIGLAIRNRYGQTVTSINSAMLDCPSISHEEESYRCFEFEFDLLLEAGQYSLRLGLNREPGPGDQGRQPLDGTDWFGPVTVSWDYEKNPAPFLGMFGLPMSGRWRCASTRTSAQVGEAT
jgi:lipopolysaccharide transport system ATP-binding protein